MPFGPTEGRGRFQFLNLTCACVAGLIGLSGQADAQSAQPAPSAQPAQAARPQPNAEKRPAAARKTDAAVPAAVPAAVKKTPTPPASAPAPQGLAGDWKVNWLQKKYVATSLTITDLKPGENTQAFDGQTVLLSGEKCPLRGVAANGVTALAPDAANGSQFGVLKIIKITADCENGARMELDLLGVSAINNPIGRATVIAKDGAREESAVSLTRPVQTP